jgi:hypothetical protein
MLTTSWLLSEPSPSLRTQGQTPGSRSSHTTRLDDDGPQPCPSSHHSHTPPFHAPMPKLTSPQPSSNPPITPCTPLMPILPSPLILLSSCESSHGPTLWRWGPAPRPRGLSAGRQESAVSPAGRRAGPPSSCAGRPCCPPRTSSPCSDGGEGRS